MTMQQNFKCPLCGADKGGQTLQEYVLHLNQHLTVAAVQTVKTFREPQLDPALAGKLNDLAGTELLVTHNAAVL